MMNTARYILVLLLIPYLAFAGLPPTTLKGQSDAGKTTTFDYQVPFSQATRTSSVSGLIETGNMNLLKNPGFEHTTYSTGWTASGGTSAVGTTTNIGFGSKSYTWNSSSASQTLTSDAITVPEGLKGQNGELGIYIKVPSGTATHLLQAYDGTNILNSTTITSSTGFVYNSVSFIWPTSGSVSLRLVSVASDEPLIALDEGYMGPFKSINVSQATMYGTIKYAGTASCLWMTGDTGGNLTDFGADTDCATPTITGNASAPSTKVPRIKFASLPPGRYMVVFSGLMGPETTATTATFNWRGYDGTSYNGNTRFDLVGGTAIISYTQLISYFEYTTAQTNIEFRPRASSSSNSNDPYVAADTSVKDFEIQVYRFPTQSEMGYRPDLYPAAPTVQRLTSGSGTYTLPTNPKPSYLRIRMVGGGGGGAGSSTTANNNGSGGTGGNTTFGTSLLTANGGEGGVGSGAGRGGVGGTVTVNSPATTVVATSGGNGTGSPLLSAGGYGSGGPGAASPFGGAGGGGQASGGSAVTAVANTGSGGGGGGGVPSGLAGSGGAAGGYIEAIIYNPSATYSYSVGTAGTAGSAGTSGNAGGAGGSGFIEVTEYYGQSPAPLLVGSVTSNSTGLERVERASGTCSSSASIGSQSGSWLSSIANISSGSCTITLNGTPFTAAPTCTVTGDIDNTAIWAKVRSTSTSQVLVWGWNTTSAAAATTFTFHLHCMGPR